jgi:FG-GAP-like repeat
MTTLHITNSINRSPLRLAFLLIAVPLACLVMTSAARAETATAVGNCRSIVLDPASGYLPGLGQLRTYVSTYDGQPGFPLYQPLPNGSILFSGELRSGNAQTGLYATDFATYDSVWSVRDYGSFTVTLPITDSDQNGLPDVVQRDKPGNAQVYGSVVSDFTDTFSNITGTLSRSANSIAGTYVVNVTTGSTTIRYSGSLYLFNVSGTCTYSRNAGTISFAFNETLPHGGNRTLSGLTTFEVVDANRITLRQFNVNASDGSAYSVLATILTRSGNKYRGNLQLADGNLPTYWRDYTSWVVEILDQNDSNQDGIPNLSDPTGPTPDVVDFNGDGKPDYVLYNASTHQTAIWYMNSNVHVGGAFGPTLPAGWSLVSVADFNRDRHPDYLLFNPSTRQTAIWYMNNNVRTAGAVGPTLPSGWDTVATGLFNGDLHQDFVLYNTNTHQTALWYMNSNVHVGGAFGPTLPAGWRLAGVADFNGNGQTDYALFNPSTRQTAIYYLSGPVYVSYAFGPTIASGYELMGTADFNGNGKPDYLLYNAGTRRTALHYLNNNVYAGSALGPVLPAGWSLVTP